MAAPRLGQRLNRSDRRAWRDVASYRCCGSVRAAEVCLKGGSLIRLLARHRQARNRKGLPRLSIKIILKWADRHHDRTGS
jgi:hypothetical protein